MTWCLIYRKTSGLAFKMWFLGLFKEKKTSKIVKNQWSGGPIVPLYLSAPIPSDLLTKSDMSFEMSRQYLSKDTHITSIGATSIFGPPDIEVRTGTGPSPAKIIWWKKCGSISSTQLIVNIGRYGENKAKRYVKLFYPMPITYLSNFHKSQPNHHYGTANPGKVEPTLYIKFCSPRWALLKNIYWDPIVSRSS